MQKIKIDEIMLVLIVALLIIAIKAIDNINESTVEKEKKITENLLSNKLNLVNGDVVDEYRLKEIQKMNYDDLKKFFNIKNDFCIYIEDENGNVILDKGSNELDGVCKKIK